MQTVMLTVKSNIRETVMEAIRNPVIVHYTGASKPWQYNNNHPFKSDYWKNIKNTPFRKSKIEGKNIKNIIVKYFPYILTLKKKYG